MNAGVGIFSQSKYAHHMWKLISISYMCAEGDEGKGIINFAIARGEKIRQTRAFSRTIPMLNMLAIIRVDTKTFLLLNFPLSNRKLNFCTIFYDIIKNKIS